MNKKTKRFFVLKSFKDFFLPDAITVDSDKPADSDIVSEAESIINDYFKKMGYGENKKGSKGVKPVLLYSGIAIAAVMAVIALLKLL